MYFFVFVLVFSRTQIIAISRWCVFNHFCWQRHLPSANKEAKLFNWTQLLVITRSDASCFSLIQHKDHKKLCVRAFCGYCCCCCAFALLLFFFFTTSDEYSYSDFFLLVSFYFLVNVLSPLHHIVNSDLMLYCLVWLFFSSFLWFSVSLFYLHWVTWVKTITMYIIIGFCQWQKSRPQHHQATVVFAPATLAVTSTYKK